MRRLGRYTALLGAGFAAGEAIGYVIFWVNQRRAS